MYQCIKFLIRILSEILKRNYSLYCILCSTDTQIIPLLKNLTKKLFQINPIIWWMTLIIKVWLEKQCLQFIFKFLPERQTFRPENMEEVLKQKEDKEIKKLVWQAFIWLCTLSSLLRIPISNLLEHLDALSNFTHSIKRIFESDAND